MSKKILAILMAVAMAFSLLPVTVLAEENKSVAKVGDVTYTSLDAAVEAAKNTDDAIIDVLADCTTAGLNLSKDLTIQGAEGLEPKPTIKFTKNGIALWGKSLTFKNCNVEMKGIGSTPYTAEWNWQTICASRDASLTLDGATMTMDGTDAGNAHAIYFCSNNKLNLSNGSKLEIKNYKDDALEWDGGDGGYNVNIKEKSTFISDHNRSGFTGTFYATIDNSTVNVINSTGNGSNGSHFDIKNDSKVEFNNNKAHGLSAGILKVSNSKVTANNNGGNGIHVGESLTISEESVVEIQNNECSISSTWTIPGALYVAKGKESTIDSTIDATSKVTISKNNGSGILLKSGNLSISEGADIAITENTAEKLGYGGGVNVRGNLILPSGAVLYNNHAENAGDDIYSTGTITFGKVGTDWTLDDCGHLITGWFKDGEKTGETEQLGRWSAHQKPVRIDEFTEFINGTAAVTSSADVDLALKAAHGEMAVDPAQSEISKSKTATNLDSNYESKVTLSIPSSEEQLVSDVVFVLDKSTSANLESQALAMLSNLKNQIKQTGAKVNVGVVIFNKVANIANDGKFFDLATEYDDIESAIKQEISSGTNTHAGLLAGKDMLDADKTVDSNRKYLVFVSDGITYIYNKEPTVTAWTFLGDAWNNWAGPDNWASKYSSTEAPRDWNAWIQNIALKVTEQGTNYEYPYGGTVSQATPQENWNTAYANSTDKALYLTYQVYQDIVEAGYHCYAMTAESDSAQVYPWGTSFMSYLSDGKEVTFDSIQNDILYTVSAGSRVEDYMGYVEGDYNFDFINDASKLSITVGTGENKETLEAAVIGENHYGFGPVKKVQEPEAGQEMTTSEISYRYELKYEPGQKKGDEHFTWRINVPVSNFAPVALTYSVKLVNPKSASGTYGQYDEDGSKNYSGLYTNNSATLYPMDSKGQSGVPENFLKPTVSYTVSGGNSGGNNGGNSKPSLNTKDHYGYIIGYPVDYYTGQPTTDQTKKPVRPEGKITRAEVATIYFRMLTDESRTKFWSQSSGYSDVKAGDWFNNAVSTLSNAGIIAGYEDGSFRPNGYITRAEFATIAARFFDVTYNGKDLFPDISGHWAKDYINQAANKGFVNGYEDGTFKPDRNITRAEAVTLVNRTLDRHPDKSHFTKDMLVWPDNMDQTKWYYADMQEATNSHTYQMKENSDKTKYENWTKTLPIRNWEALEKAWSNANSSQGNGNVV